MITCLTHTLGNKGQCTDCGANLIELGILTAKPKRVWYAGERVGVIHSPLTGSVAYRVGAHDSNKRCTDVVPEYHKAFSV